MVDVLGLDWKSFEPILGERAAANLRNRRKSMASLGLTKWLRQKGVQDMGSLMLVGDQGECCKDLCLWTQLDVKEVRGEGVCVYDWGVAWVEQNVCGRVLRVAQLHRGSVSCLHYNWYQQKLVVSLVVVSDL